MAIEPEVRTAAVELRGEDSPTLHGVIIAEGRAAAGGRAEVFAPGAVVWPLDGIGISTEHRAEPVARAVPERDQASGEVRVTVPAGPEIRAAVAGGRRFMSVEFYALAERRTRAGVREIRRALVDQAALVTTPEYDQATAEVRARRRKVWL